MKWINLLIILLSQYNLQATAQVPDLLLIEEDTVYLLTNPLEVYLRKADLKEIPGLKGCSSTACWRGYVATWELRNDSVFLKEIGTCHTYRCDTIQNADLATMFGEQYQNEEVFANWISYELLSPAGELLKYEHSGYQSIYAYEKGFVFSEGLLQETILYDNTKTNRSIYAENADSLLWFLYQHIDWAHLRLPETETPKRVLLAFKVNSAGGFYDIEVYRSINDSLTAEAIRVLNLIPNWTIYYRKGEPVPVQWNLPVHFDLAFYERRFGEKKEE